jgi:tetratricopeptide (TPR) repeat protein
MTTTLLLYCCLLAQTTSSTSGLSPEVMQYVEAGTAAEKAGQFEAAIAQFQRAADLGQTAPLYVRLGSAYMENHQYAEAIQSFQKAVDLAPDIAAAHQLLGLCQLAQGYAADAIPHLTKAQEFGALGIAQIQTGQPSDAVANLRAAIQKTPNDPDLLYYLSQASEMLAQQSADALLQNYPDSARAHEKLGQNFFALRKFAESEGEYRKALALRPDAPGLHLELGQVYSENSQWSKAEEEYRLESKLQPGNAEPAFRLGLALLQEGRSREALQELKRSDQLRPDMSETLYSLGKAAYTVGDTGGAEHAWLQVIAIEKESLLAAQAHFALAGLYRKQGKSAEAAREMRAFRQVEEATSQSRTR